MAKYKFIRVDFFKVHIAHGGKISNAYDGFLEIKNGGLPSVFKNNGFNRELYKIIETDDGRICGSFRKFREDDLPQISSIGGDEIDLTLNDGEGIVEQNCFIYYPKVNVLAMHFNTHANHYSRLAETLSSLWGGKVELSTMISADQFKRLNNPNSTLVAFEAKIPKPANPKLLPEPDDFARDSLELLDRADGDYMDIRIAVDRRFNGGMKRLKGLKNSLATFKEYDPQRLFATIDEGGIISSIDLIAERIKRTKKIETAGRHISRIALYNLINEAYFDAEADINEYLNIQDS
ncbi:DUF6731 family protein [Acinetobacter baumannii]|uniref:DUF6731 family protein n=1 Tax=Acinetobacter baumannii TaxID=470 RepID=UPI00244B42CF|nr:DUF6731 family protein [Acinetobacter baumannii]MDH2488075.1 hypothetical protein [Acinetobacter baumannii]